MSTKTAVNESKTRPGGFPDLSMNAGAKPNGERSAALIEQDIADRMQYRQLRQYSFFGVGGVIIMLLLMFVGWTGSFGMRLFYGAHQADPGTSGLLLTPIVVIAALVVVPLLALIRFVFRENGRIEDGKNDLSIWQLLVKELADVKDLSGQKQARRMTSRPPRFRRSISKEIPVSDMLSISIPDGNFDAYVAYPAQTPAPAVIVIQEIFGINGDMRETCEEYARQGYVALCPDLFWRLEPNVELTDRTEAEWQQAMKYYTAFDVNTGVEDIAATIGFARGLSQVKGKIGSVGFCLGGLLSFLTAARTDVDAAVSYYGGGTDQHLGELPKIKVPLMLHLAEEDEFIPADARNRVLAAVKGLANVEAFTYPGCHHAFARNKGAHYDAAAAQLANGRTAEFFTKHLK